MSGHNGVVTPVTLPIAVLARVDETARVVAQELGIGIDTEVLLGGRAALLGLRRRGRTSAGGATQLLPADDGWCALTLSRGDDIDAVPALVECDEVGTDPWPVVRRGVRRLGAATFAERARLLGLPVGVLGETAPTPMSVRRLGDRRPRRALTDLLVADLSSMWAGPLCGALLARAGATVVKVETAARPDGTRSGPAEFHNWINGEKLSYCADFDDPEPVRTLLRVADVVLESSRPGALARHGLGFADLGPRDGQVWIRITGHGTEGERGGWVAFGDDAAVSGGLVSGGLVGGGDRGPEFCGDALADPLSGLHATQAVLHSLNRGGGEVVDVVMAAVAAHYAGLAGDTEKPCTAVPQGIRPAPALGSDNERVAALVADRWAA